MWNNKLVWVLDMLLLYGHSFVRVVLSREKPRLGIHQHINWFPNRARSASIGPFGLSRRSHNAYVFLLVDDPLSKPP